MFALALLCISVAVPATTMENSAKSHVPHVVTVSWYGPGFQGKPMANGERYNMYAMTAAHQKLPLGTVVHLRNPANGKTVVVTIADRGPYVSGRSFDLSKGAAQKLGIVQQGIASVEVLKIEKPDG
jgi:rare lipoprotein A